LHGNEKFIKNLHSGELIEVHRATIKTMSGSSITLSNGETIPADAIVFATGWNYESAPLDATDAIDLGLPTPLEHQDTETATYWEKLHIAADKDVLQTFPVLKNPPPFHEREVKHTPFRLYRHILPSSLAANQDRSLIFLGLVTNIQTSIYSEISALWGVSWMEGLLDVPLAKDQMDYEITKVNAWCARRYLSRGRTRQIASAEIQDVVDMLMVDMGLKVKRKWNPIADIFVPYRSQDYKGVVQEMVKKSRAS
jgi:dimethylaniline monooxygenase (N-oxide forming)